MARHTRTIVTHSIQLPVEIPRYCDHCQQSYIVRDVLSASADEMFGGLFAKHIVKKNVESQHKYLHSTEGQATRFTICPNCKQFSNESFRAHFPLGIREKLLNHLEVEMIRYLKKRTRTITFVIVFFFMPFHMPILFSTDFLDAPPVDKLFGVFITGMFWIALLIYGNRYWNNKSKKQIEKSILAVNNVSDNELYRLVTFEYILSNEDLKLPHLLTPTGCALNKDLDEGVTPSSRLKYYFSVAKSNSNSHKSLRSQSKKFHLPEKYYKSGFYGRIASSIELIKENYDLSFIKENSFTKSRSKELSRKPLEIVAHCKCGRCPDKGLTVNQVFAISKYETVPTNPNYEEHNENNDEQVNSYMLEVEYVDKLVCRDEFIRRYSSNNNNNALNKSILKQSNKIANVCMQIDQTN